VIAADKLGEGPRLRWQGFIFEDVVVQKNPTLLPQSAKGRSAPFQRLLVLIAYSFLPHGSIDTLPNKAGKVAASLTLDGNW
jgi:hypothetical protein